MNMYVMVPTDPLLWYRELCMCVSSVSHFTLPESSHPGGIAREPAVAVGALRIFKHGSLWGSISIFYS